MRTAIELVPWLSPSAANEYNAGFNCELYGEPPECEYPPEARAKLHCGWMPESDWVGEKPDFAGRVIGDPTTPGGSVELEGLPVCPGWLVRQPPVAQMAQAYSAYEKSALATYFPREENVVLEGAQLMARCMSAYQLVQLRKARG